MHTKNSFENRIINFHIMLTHQVKVKLHGFEFIKIQIITLVE